MVGHGKSRSLLDRWGTHLARRSLPHFNQLVIWLLLGISAILACTPPYQLHIGARQGPATLLSWLPEEALSSPWPFTIFRAAIVCGAVLWLAQRWLPWSCWLVVIGFTGLWSMHVENAHNTSHIYHMANMLLVIQAIWITSDARPIREAKARGAYWTTPLVPRWVTLASIAYIGLFHTAAGISKLYFSGTDWASGTSLQLWTYLWGRPWSPTTQLILSSRTLTAWLQLGTLVIETAGILAVFPRLRTWIGIGLLAFYVGVIATFPYGFEFNALLTAVYFLPVERWIEHRLTAKGRTNAPMPR